MPRHEIDEKLVEIWSDVLGISSGISIDDDFFQSGGHSLKASILVSRIYRELGVKIPLVTVFQEPTIRKLADLISGSQQTVFYDIPLSEEKEFYPISFNQRRLYVLHQMQPLSPAFHIPGVIELNGHEVNPQTIEKVLKILTQRHDSFRTAFLTVEEYPFQFVSEEIKISFEFIDLSMMNPEERNVKFDTENRRISETPFDLSHPPLFRSALVKLESNRFYFIYNMHHIISDGWSLEVLQKEFLELYNGFREEKPVELEVLPVRYRDFASWFNERLEGPEGEKSHRFWKEQLEGGVPVLRLPADDETGKDDTSGAGWIYFIDNNLKNRLKVIAEQQNTTLFSVLFSVYNLFLADISGQETVSCSVITAGRDHPSLLSLIGFFVNSIIIKIPVDKQEAFRELLLRVYPNVIQCFNHQTYPLEKVFEESGVQYPEITVSFNMFNLDNPSGTQGQEMLEPVFLEQSQDVKFDLEIYLTEMSNGISMAWAYKRKMFQPSTMKYMLERYMKQLEFFGNHPERCLNEFKMEENKLKPGRFKKQKG